MDIATAAPLDECGRLLHDADPAAQVALATARLESALAASGRSVLDLAAVRVLTTDTQVVGPVLDVVTDRLAELGSAATLEVVDVAALDRPGQLVALEPVLGAPSTPESR